jgi:hypothetical protein
MCKWLVSQIFVWHSEWCCHSVAVMHSGRRMDFEIIFTPIDCSVGCYSFAGTWTDLMYIFQHPTNKSSIWPHLLCCFFFFLIRLFHVSTWLSWNVTCLVSFIKLSTWITILSVWKWRLVQYKDERECRPWHCLVHVGIVNKVAMEQVLLRGLTRYHSTHASYSFVDQ